MAYATPDDVEARLGRELDETETRLVETRLADVELLIKSRVPDLDEQIANGKIDPALVVMIEAEAILRLIRNPDGYTQETDGTYSYTISKDVASGKLSLLDGEWWRLGVGRGIYSIAPYVDMPRRYPNTWEVIYEPSRFG